MRSFRRAALVSGLYMAFAGAWIIWSDNLVRSVSSSVEEMHRFEHAKGLFFVLATGLALFASMLYLLRRAEEEALRAATARETLLQLERHSLAGLFVSSIVHDANNVATVVSSALEELKSVESRMDQSVKAGDQLRFSFHAPEAGWLAIFELDGTEAVELRGSFEVTPGPAVLPGAFELDAAPGPEWFVSVYSTKPLDLAALSAQLRGQALQPRLTLDCGNCKVEAVRVLKEPL